MDNDAFWQIFISIATPAVAVFTFLMSRRHQQKVEQTDSVAGAISAVTDANVNISAIVQGLIQPMQDRQDQMRQREAELEAELEEVRTEMAERFGELERRFTAAVTYIRQLHSLLGRNGLTPPAAPPELDDHLDD